MSPWCSSLPVLAAALAWGLGRALAAALLAVLGYNFFFLDPLYTLQDQRSRERGRPGPVLGRGGPGQRHRRAHPRADAGRPRQEAARAAALYAFAKKLTGVATIDDLLWAAAHQVAVMLKAEVVFLLPEDGSLDRAGRLPARGPARRQRSRRGRMVLAQRHARRPRLGQSAGGAAPVPPAAHRPRQARRGRHPQGSGRAAADPGRAPPARRAARPDRARRRPRPARPRRRRDQAAGRDRAPAHRPADLDRPRSEDAAGLDPGRDLGPAQLRRLLRRGRPRRAAGDRPGGGRAAGALRRQPARHDAAGGRCARARSASRSTSPTPWARPCVAPAGCWPAIRSRPTCRPTCRCCGPTSSCWSRCW